MLGGAGPVAGDELSDAVARQKALSRQIAAQKSKVAQINRLQARVQGEISATKNTLKGINADLAAVRKNIDGMVLQIEEVKAVYTSLVAELARLDGELARLRAEEAVKKAELAERKAILAERIRVAYATDRTSLLELILTAETFTDALAEVSYNLDIAEQDREIAELIRKDAETLVAIQGMMLETRKATDVLRVETAAQKKELDARLVELKEARETLEELENQTQIALAEQKAAYDLLAQNERALRSAIGKSTVAKKNLGSQIAKLIDQQKQRGNIPSQYNGAFEWPMKGSISGEFGCSSYPYYGPGNGCAHFHNGIDIVAPYGTAVKAAGNGTIVYIGWNYADGYDPAWIVVVALSSNLQTWYAHMQPRYPNGIRAGTSVKTGDVIGYEGNTGNSSGAHLHWMVMLNGNYTNPRLFL